MGASTSAARRQDPVLRRVGPLALLERRLGPRVSPEVLLVPEAAGPRPGERAIDLGAGNGVLAFLLLAAEPGLVDVTLVEVEPALAELARMNADRLGVADRAHVVTRDVAAFRGTTADLVVANPPFYPVGWGKPPADSIAHAASHEVRGGLGVFLDAAVASMAPGGRLVLVWGTDRLAEAMAAMAWRGLGVERLVFARHMPRGRIHRVVVVARPGGQGLVSEVHDVDYAGFRTGAPWA